MQRTGDPCRPLAPGAAGERRRALRVGGRLVAWFRAEARPWPWRGTRDPYAIWVAEVLLQQTRVDQALPYYRRFLATFPTLRDLAAAPTERVLKVWEGAGYYARAHRMQAAAREVVRRWGGHLPHSADALAELPGFGPYTARSVAALAFGERTVALDANGRRVLSRLFLLKGSPGDVDRQAETWGRTALGRREPRAFNEGLMELGQRFCTARRPRCTACPLRSSCRAAGELPDPGAHPPPRPLPPRPRVVAAVALLRRGGRLLVARRPLHGLLPGLWEFPGGKVEPGETPGKAVLREVREETGVRARLVQPLGRVEHDYSHFHATLHVFALEVPAGERVRPPDGRPHRWVDLEGLRRLPLPRANAKMLGWAERYLATAGRRGISRRTSLGSGPPRGRTSA